MITSGVIQALQDELDSRVWVSGMFGKYRAMCKGRELDKLDFDENAKEMAVSASGLILAKGRHEDCDLSHEDQLEVILCLVKLRIALSMLTESLGVTDAQISAQAVNFLEIEVELKAKEGADVTTTTC